MRRAASQPRSAWPSPTSSPGCSARSACLPRCAPAWASASTCRSSSRPSRCSSTRRRTPSSASTSPTRRGNAHPNIVPYETFATADGEIAVAVGSERQWPRLCHALGLDQLADRPALRRQRRARAQPHRAAALCWPIGSRLSRRRTGWPPWTRPRCRAARSTTSPRPSHSRRHSSAACRELVDHPRLGPISQVGLPYKLSATPASIRSAPPLLGEHADEILAELGYDGPAIEALRREGVI